MHTILEKTETVMPIYLFVMFITDYRIYFGNYYIMIIIKFKDMIKTSYK